MLKEGFYCALGTPLDQRGELLSGSLKKHVDGQIENGASGLLLMGTMGMLGCIRDDQYEPIVAQGVRAVAGRVPLLVGAADNSIARMKARLKVLEKYPVAAVLTAPYYFGMDRGGMMRYFKAAAEGDGNDLYLYDHPFTARRKIELEDVLELAALPRYKGIKTGDAVLIRKLHESKELKADFTPIFSNSDLFSMARTFGIHRTLDGIYACFPKTTGEMQRAWDRGDMAAGNAAVNRIMKARDGMIALGIWPAFTAAMNLLGYEGSFGPDYERVFDPDKDAAQFGTVRRLMEEAGEIGKPA